MTLFFGCWHKEGHFLWTKHKDQFRELHECDIKARDLDCSAVFLIYPPKLGQGCKTFLPAQNKTILSWWGNPFDDRPGTNNSVIVDGCQSIQQAWNIFKTDFPDVAKFWTIYYDNENDYQFKVNGSRLFM